MLRNFTKTFHTHFMYLMGNFHFSITIQDMEGKKIFSENMGPREYTKGGGWSPLNAQNSEQSISSKFSRYIHENVGKQMVVVTRLR